MADDIIKQCFVGVDQDSAPCAMTFLHISWKCGYKTFLKKARRRTIFNKSSQNLCISYCIFLYVTIIIFWYNVCFPFCRLSKITRSLVFVRLCCTSVPGSTQKPSWIGCLHSALQAMPVSHNPSAEWCIISLNLFMSSK